MLAAMVTLLAVAAASLYAQAALEILEAQSDPQAAQLWEAETRAFGWRWFA